MGESALTGQFGKASRRPTLLCESIFVQSTALIGGGPERALKGLRWRGLASIRAVQAVSAIG
eukprot:5728533-Alexandrium_andersonii.AAC.1